MLRDDLTEVAAQAKLYDVVDQAVVIARRRRRLGRFATAAAAMVAATGFLAVAVPWFGGGHGQAPGTSLVSWLPDKVESPTVPAPPLPADHGVGAGALVHGSGVPGGAPPVLVTEDGHRYRLAQPVVGADGVGSQSPILSPDGRWLGERRGTTFVLRDLTATGTRELPGDLFPVGWSPDSRWLLFNRSGDGTDAVLLDLATSQQVPVKVDDPAEVVPVAVLATGDVVFVPTWSYDLPRRDVDTRVVDPESGTQVRHVQLDLAGQLPPADELSPRALLSTDGRTLVLSITQMRRTAEGTEIVRDGDLLLVDLQSTVVTRVNVPYEPFARSSATPQPGPSAPVLTGHRSTPLSAGPAGILLRTENAAGMAVGLVDPATGEIRTVTDLPDTHFVAIRGST